MKFLVIDFETANNDNSSICQIGLVEYNNGKYRTLIDTLINPETYFTNTYKHHISENDVIDSPRFPVIHNQLTKLIENEIVFNHNGSDKSKLTDVCNKYGLSIPNVIWLNSATVVRRTWEQFSKSGYGVENMCDYLGIDLKAHNAASDALATAEIINKACEIKNYTINDWIKNLKSRPRQQFYPNHQKISGDLTTPPDLDKIENKDNPFFGKKVVVSGTYITWPDRKELAKILQELGADIDGSIGKYTNILCAGKGVGPSKLDKMKTKIANGEDAVILSEEEIIKMINASA